MATALLIGSSRLVLNLIPGLLSLLGHRVLLASEPGHHQRSIILDIAITEFCPQQLSWTECARRVRLLRPLQTLVIGPELSEELRAQLLTDEHVADYLMASAPAHELLEGLRAWLPETQRAVLTLGPLQLDLQKQTVYYGARPLPFTPTEIRLLQALMQRPGQAADCATLEALVHCQNVQTHLSNMRHKLDRYSGVPLLRGSPSKGYTLDARRSPRHRPDPRAALKTHLQSLI